MWDKKEDESGRQQGRAEIKGDKPAPSRRLWDSTSHANTGLSMDKPSPEKSPSTTHSQIAWQVALSQQILSRHQVEPPTFSGDWMSKLKEESVQFLRDQNAIVPAESKESLYKRGMEILIDKIFALMQRYMCEFNKVAGGTELHVSGTISGEVTEVTRFNKLREAEETETYFRARFSTRLYSLVLRGRDEVIDFFLLPTNKTMALSKGERDYKPLATIQIKITAEGMMWRMAAGVPPVDTLEHLSMWLFGRLIQETKKAASLGSKDSN